MRACDERILIMLFLVIEKLRGQVRLSSPYMCLPPLCLLTHFFDMP